MEKHFILDDVHYKCQVTAIAFHPVRREIVAGFEDGSMKWWEQDSGKLMMTTREHTGWVTDFIFIHQRKYFFSCSHDGFVVVWGSGGNVLEKIRIGGPIYTVAHNIRRGQLVLGMTNSIMLYWLDFDQKATTCLNISNPEHSRDHTDIVNCVVCNESRVYTAGYDCRMCIYDTTFGKAGLSLIYRNNYAHEAGITCMIMIRDNDNNKWLLTGSFDQSVKVWSQDGKLRQSVSSCFYDTITSICYLPRARLAWIASNGQKPILFDPKSGENVTEFIPTFESDTKDRGNDYYYHRIVKLRNNPDSGQLVSATSRRHVIVWKFIPSGCITSLKLKCAIESLAYTKKAPLLFFSGAADGCVYKWERSQNSTFIFSVDQLSRKESLEKQEALLYNRGELPDSVSTMYLNLASGRKNPELPKHVIRSKNISLLNTRFVEHLDLLVVSSEDGNCYVWGFDYAVVSALKDLENEKKAKKARKASDYIENANYNLLKGSGNGTPSDIPSTPIPSTPATTSTPRDSITPGRASTPAAGLMVDEPHSSNQSSNGVVDSVTDRVAGFICKNVLLGHASCVSAMCVIYNKDLYETTFLLTGGWDRRLLIWNLNEQGKYYDQLRYPDTQFGCIPDGTLEDGGMFACDGVILHLEYCAKRNEFAYASSDNIVYIRSFSNDGSLMHIKSTLEGHEQEITAIKWNEYYQKWVTSSEDGTIKVWAEDGSVCEDTLNTQGIVTTICIDLNNGCVVAAVDHFIKVFDLETNHLVQTNVGHTENIRCIMHVVELSQYMSGSYDNTLRIWNSYRKPAKKIKKEN